MAISGTLGICFCLGALVAPWLSVLAGNWRIYLTCSALLQLVVALFYFVVQESAQWLITRTNVEGAIARLKRLSHHIRLQLGAVRHFSVHFWSRRHGKLLSHVYSG